jgi:exodeoxyribonuclease VII large subunit
VSEASSSDGDHRRIYGVSELLGGLSGLLEDRVGRVWVVGEISNLHRAGSGHCYFTLKDDAGQLRAALFRSSAERVAFDLEEGLEVLVYADVTVYAARGDLQLVVRRVEPRGRGALQLAFEQLRRRLETEGLFDPGRKRELPEHPRCVGVVTSPTSAAVRDVIQVSGRRSPGTPLVISPTRVQGEGSGAEIAAALDRIAADGRVDVILLVRGGGSLEDLWAFNTEEVARAIARSPLPIVSGVGHETDLTIADLVADLRAPTPSAAAAMALPDGEALAQQLSRDWRRLGAAARAALRGFEARLARERDALRMLAPSTRLAAQRSRARALQRALGRAIEREQERRRAALATLAGRLDSLSPLAVLARGYALVERAEDGAILRDSDAAPAGERLRIRLARGELWARSEGEAAARGDRSRD